MSPSPREEDLLARLPDEPRWAETRWLLASGEGRGHADGDDAVVVARRLPLAAVVGRPSPALLRELVDAASADLELIVQAEDHDHVRAALDGWTTTWARLHRWPGGRPLPSPPTDIEVVVSDPPSRALLAALSDDARLWARPARALAVHLVDGQPVSLCIALAVTETLWDVGVETDPTHRRRGCATACFAALAHHLAADGLQPMWGAAEDNEASLALAACLGFVPDQRIALLTPPVPG
jgi:GNAT superfamily N-acetyltransferase